MLHGLLFSNGFSRRIVSLVSVAAVCAVCLSAGTAAEGPPPGRELYLKQCASCHGDNGQGGTADYEQPLIGDLSTKQLAKYVHETMPADDPEQCVDADALAVARYIHEAFYSVTARARNAPPRVELSRLTNEQYRNSVADLVGSFSWTRNHDSERGLQAEYFKSRRTDRKNRLIERRDSRIDIGFGTGELTKDATVGQHPAVDKIEKKKEYPEYTVVWRGAVFAPETGEYTITLNTQNAGRVWLNNNEQPLINARVRSGDQMDYRATLPLLGGRYYPLRVEYIKAKSDATGSVRLKWEYGSQPEQVIPERYLSPHQFSETLVVATKFPPDDRSVGYERGVSISPEWDAATTQAALEVVNELLPQLQKIAKLKGSAEQQSEQLKSFCEQFVERAFRQPLTAAQRELYIDRQFATAANPREATKRVLLLALKSPRFLFPESALSVETDAGTAGWLALTLWDSLPDQRLRELASQGKLQTREQIHAEAIRMLQQPAARAKLLGFLRQWLYFNHFEELEKDDEKFPQFGPNIAGDLRTSLELQLAEIIDSDAADYRQLLQSRSVYLNQRLADFYEITLTDKQSAAGGDFQKTAFDEEHRAGVLTHPYLLTGLAYDDASSPIHRGVFLTRNVLGRFLKPPPIAVAPTPVDLHPDVTTRERVQAQTNEALCMNCHGTINELGFSLEHFDAVGRYREKEHGHDINAGGEYTDRSGETVKFRGAPELAAYLVNSRDAQTAFTEHLFQHLTKQPAQAFGTETLEVLRDRFVKQNYNIRKLMAEIVTESIVRRRGQLKEPRTE